MIFHHPADRSLCCQKKHLEKDHPKKKLSNGTCMDGNKKTDGVTSRCCFYCCKSTYIVSMSKCSRCFAFLNYLYDYDHEYMRCLSANAPCHYGLDLSKRFSTGAFLWGSTAASAICSSCMAQAYVQCQWQFKTGKGVQSSLVK
eukprot:379778-Pelagomonas_calceolata.AAC.2